MKKTRLAFLLVLLSLAVGLNLVGCHFSQLSPPSWIQGSWSNAYCRWEFTSNDVFFANFDSGNTYDHGWQLGNSDSSTSTTYTLTSSTGADLFTKVDAAHISWEMVGEGLGASTLYKD